MEKHVAQMGDMNPQMGVVLKHSVTRLGDRSRLRMLGDPGVGLREIRVVALKTEATWACS